MPQTKPQRLSDALSSYLSDLEDRYGSTVDDVAQAVHDADETPTERARPCGRCNQRGKVSRTRHCDCPYGQQRHEQAQRHVTETFPRAGVPARLKRYTLDSWDDLCGDDPKKENARRFVQQIVDDGVTTEPNGEQRPGLLLHGPNSVGKTGLMVALARHLWDTRRVLLWVRYEAMIRDIQSRYGVDAYEDGTANADALIASAQRVPHLFIDDLGRPFADESQFRESEDRRELLYEILAYRHERDMPTYLTTNLDKLTGVAKQFDRRIADRVMELCTVCAVGGRNLRKPNQ